MADVGLGRSEGAEAGRQSSPTMTSRMPDEARARQALHTPSRDAARLYFFFPNSAAKYGTITRVSGAGSASHHVLCELLPLRAALALHNHAAQIVADCALCLG